MTILSGMIKLLMLLYEILKLSVRHQKEFLVILKPEHPEVEWRRIIGFRNRIIHEYFGIDYENLRRIKNENIPILFEFMEQILEDLEN